MAIYQLGDKKPVIPASCFIAESATIIGDVTLGERVSVLTVDEAKGAGAIGVFGDKYGDKVKVYTMGPSTGSGQVFSKEICGGPHVARTGMLGSFKIQKEESSSAGVRRIKAVVSGGPKEIEVAGEA